ncbi:MAG: hypothetical protein ACOCW1_04370 [Chitinispirillaceae bacterium]
MIHTLSANHQLFSRKPNRSVVHATVERELEQKGSYLLKTENRELVIKLAKGSLKAGQNVLISPSEGEVLIAKSQPFHRFAPEDSFTSTEQNGRLSELISKEKQIPIAEDTQHPDGIYKFKSDKELLRFLGLEESSALKENTPGARTLLLHTSGGKQTATLLNEKALSESLNAVHKSFQSDILKALPPSFLDRVLSERNEINLDTIGKLDSILSKLTIPKQPLSDIQIERISQWMHILLDNSKLAESLAERIPLSGADEIPVRIDQMNKLFSAAETVLPSPEQFFLYDEAMERCEDKTALLMRLFSQAGFSREAQSPGGGLKQILTELLRNISLHGEAGMTKPDLPHSFQPVVEKLLEQLITLPSKELDALYGNSLSLPEVLTAEIVNAKSGELSFGSIRMQQDLSATLNKLEDAVFRVLTQVNGSNELQREIENIIGHLNKTLLSLSTDDPGTKRNLANLEKVLQPIFEKGDINKFDILNLVHKTTASIRDHSIQHITETHPLPRELYQKLLPVITTHQESGENILNNIRSFTNSFNLPEGHKKNGSDQLLQLQHQISQSAQTIRTSLLKAFSGLDLTSGQPPDQTAASASSASVNQTVDNLRSELLVRISKALQDVFSSARNLEGLAKELSYSQIPKIEELVTSIITLSQQAKENGEELAGRLKNLLLELSMIQLEEGKSGAQGSDKSLSKEQFQLASSSNELLKQGAQTLLNRLESLQLLSSTIQTKTGEQQIVALPVKIGQEWTDVQIKFIKENKGNKQEGQKQNISVYLNTSPSSLGDVSVNLDYRAPSHLRLSFQFEKPEVRSWFRDQSEKIRSTLQDVGLTPAGLDFSMKRKKTTVPPKSSAETGNQSVDQSVDMKV